MFIFFILIMGFVHSVKEGLEFKFSATRFANRNPKFWNPEISRDQAKKLFGVRMDAMAAIALVWSMVCLSALVAGQYKWFQIPNLSVLWRFLIIIVSYVAAFNISNKFYLYKK